MGYREGLFIPSDIEDINIDMKKQKSYQHIQELYISKKH